MDEELQSFVSLLNRQRQLRPVPKELSGLPNWAQRELAKRPESATPRQTAPANGKSHEDKPKPEIVIEAKPIEVLPPPKPAPVPPAPVVTAADRVRDPQALLARILAEETKDTPPKPEAPLTAKVVTPVAETVAAPEKKIEGAPPKVDERKSDSAPLTLTGEKIAAEKIVPEKISLEKIIADKIETPLSVDTVSPVSATAAEMAPMQPLIAEALASPRAGRRPLAYALAAAAVIAVVAVVVGAYWYTHNEAALLADIKIGNPEVPAPNKPAPTKLVSKPQAPSPAAPAKLADKLPKPTPAAPVKLADKPPAPAPSAPAKLADKQATPTPAAPAKIATETKPSTTVKPADTPKTDTKVAAAPAPTPAPTPTAKPSPTPAIVQKTPENPQTVAAAKPSAPAATAPVVAAPKTVAKGPSPAPTQIASLTPPSLTPAAPPAKPASVAPLVAQAKPPTKPITASPPAKPAAAPHPVASGELTWQRNAVPAPAFSGQPQIAIVIDDLGLDRSRTERAIALSGPVTLSFLAYASDLPKQTDAARRAGHELIVHVPMEPILRPKYVSQGSGSADPAHAELLRRLRWDLSRFNGYVGVNNHMGNRLLADPESMQTVIGELKARGLLFLDSRAGGIGVANAAERRGVPTLTRDVLLDDDVTASSVTDRLADLEKIARQHGTAIAIGHPHDQTLDALTVWIASLPAKGLQLVPITAIVRDREQHLAGAN